MGESFHQPEVKTVPLLLLTDPPQPVEITYNSTTGMRSYARPSTADKYLPKDFSLTFPNQQECVDERHCQLVQNQSPYNELQEYATALKSGRFNNVEVRSADAGTYGLVSVDASGHERLLYQTNSSRGGVQELGFKYDQNGQLNKVISHTKKDNYEFVDEYNLVKGNWSKQSWEKAGNEALHPTPAEWFTSSFTALPNGSVLETTKYKNKIDTLFTSPETEEHVLHTVDGSNGAPRAISKR